MMRKAKENESTVLFVVILMIISVTINGTNMTTREYCQGAQFNPSCKPADEVIVIEKAAYGRMAKGKCVTTDLGYRGCSSNQLPVLDKLCSGRVSCSVVVSDAIMTEPLNCSIPTDFARNLVVTYKCLKVLDTPTIEYASSLSLRGNHDIKSNDSTCGTKSTPWIITNVHYQQINISMTNFEPVNDGSVIGMRCNDRYGYISDYSSGEASITDICPSTNRRQVVSLSHGSTVSVVFLQKKNFLLNVKLTGHSVNRSDVSLTEQVYDGCTLVIGEPKTKRLDAESEEGFLLIGGTSIVVIVILIIVIIFVIVLVYCKIKNKNTEDHNLEDPELLPLKTHELLMENIKSHYKNHCHKAAIQFWRNEDFKAINAVFIDIQYELITEEETLKHTNVNKLFTNHHCKSYIMLGNVATGKSLISQKMAYDWAIGEEWMGRFSCVFLLKPRDVTDNFSFKSHILKKYMPDRVDDRTFNSAIDKILQNGTTLLILDGYDNLTLEQDRTKPNELKLILEKKMYGNITTMITSRPSVLLQPIPHQSCFINLINFTEEGVLKYIQLYFNIKDSFTGVNWTEYRSYFTKNSKSGHRSATRNVTPEVENPVYGKVMAIEKSKLLEFSQNPIGCLTICEIFEEKQKLPDKPILVYAKVLQNLEKIYDMKGYSVEWETVISQIYKLAFDVLAKCPADEKTLQLSNEELSKSIDMDASLVCQTGVIYRVNPLTTNTSSACVPLYSFMDDVMIVLCATYYVHNQRKSGKSFRLPAIKSQRLNHFRSGAIKALFGEDTHNTFV